MASSDVFERHGSRQSLLRRPVESGQFTSWAFT